jgi:hypothetical protein
MSTELPVARFCACCSLLCEPSSEDGNFGAAFCSRRNRELDAIRVWSENRDTLSSLSPWESTLDEAKMRLAKTTDLLVTGRMRSVDSSRGALRIAQRYKALLDPWESEAAFEGITAFQRVGASTVSLAEARDISELLIVVGGDPLIEDYPRLPAALARGTSIPVLLLGPWSHAGCKPWLDAGFQVLAIDTEISNIPRSLAEASACGSIGPWESEASRWLHRSGYTTALWSMKHLNIEQGDLWYESMMEWIARENETRRVGALVWSDLESTFHQVCTWWTGFPARIRFGEDRCGENSVLYDPSRFTAQRWIDSHPETHLASSLSSPKDSRRNSSSLILWIDDSFEDLPTAVFESGHPCIAISPRAPRSDTTTLWLPSLPSGLGCKSEMFRGDHAILVSGQDPHGIAHELPPTAQWLLGLIET